MAEGILQRELLVHSMVCKRKSPHGSQILPFFLFFFAKNPFAQLPPSPCWHNCPFVPPQHCAPFYTCAHTSLSPKKENPVNCRRTSISRLPNLQGTLQELPQKKKEIGTFLSLAIYSGVLDEKIVDRHSNFWPYFSGKVSCFWHRYWICQIISNFKVSFSFS